MTVITEQDVEELRVRIKFLENENHALQGQLRDAFAAAALASGKSAAEAFKIANDCLLIRSMTE
jgi:hypothetical protein